MPDSADHVAEPAATPYEATSPAATYEDVLRAPAHSVAQVVDGELVLAPRPAPAHFRSSSGVHGSLQPPFDRRPGGPGGPGGWWIGFEPELHLGADILVPDLAGWRRERLPVFPTTPYFELPPDWVCEVLSPSTAGLDRVRKAPIYARAGVSHLWFVDPLQRTLEVFELHEGRWLLIGAFGDDAVVRAEPFDAVELELQRWWLPREGEDTAGGEGELG